MHVDSDRLPLSHKSPLPTPMSLTPFALVLKRRPKRARGRRGAAARARLEALLYSNVIRLEP